LTSGPETSRLFLLCSARSEAHDGLRNPSPSALRPTSSSGRPIGRIPGTTTNRIKRRFFTITPHIVRCLAPKGMSARPITASSAIGCGRSRTDSIAALGTMCERLTVAAGGVNRRFFQATLPSPPSRSALLPPKSRPPLQNQRDALRVQCLDLRVPPT
jgi:hypothetical protein